MSVKNCRSEDPNNQFEYPSNSWFLINDFYLSHSRRRWINKKVGLYYHRPTDTWYQNGEKVDEYHIHRFLMSE